MDKTAADEFAWLEGQSQAATSAMFDAIDRRDTDAARRHSGRAMHALFRVKWLRGELPADFDRPDLIHPLLTPPPGDVRE